MKKLLEKALLRPNNSLYFLTSDFLALATIVSIVAIVLETVPSVSGYERYFTIIEYTAVLVFTLEYAARLYVIKPKRKYVFSFFGLIDLLSILPSFVGIGNFTFLKSARAVRLIRLLRMIRLAKLAHSHRKDPEETLGVFALNVTIYITLLLVTLLAMGTLMYLAEEQVGTIMSIPAGMWWSFKVFMGGIPVDTPLTAFGAGLYVFARFVGYLLLGVLIGVIGNIFRAVLLSK
tara:strand:- start:3254 stop:3952 length:699 start_codon:yes stop_codon:yes gene_type:complete